MPEDFAPETSSGILARLNSNTERLEVGIEQAVAAIRKRGFQLPIDLSGMIRTIHQDIIALGHAIPHAESRLRQFEELVRTSALISSSLDTNQVLEDVIDTIITLAQAERGYLMLRDTHTGDLTIRTARNWDRETLGEDTAGYSRSVIKLAIEKGEPILTNNAQADERFQGIKSVMANDLRSIMCIPLVIRGETLGALYVDNRMGVGNLNPATIPIMAAFANQAAIAIQNANKYGRVKADLAEAKIEVEKLRIQVDQGRLQRQLGEITETEYFQNLQEIAHSMRNRSRGASDE